MASKVIRNNRGFFLREGVLRCRRHLSEEVNHLLLPRSLSRTLSVAPSAAERGGAFRRRSSDSRSSSSSSSRRPLAMGTALGATTPPAAASVTGTRRGCSVRSLSGCSQHFENESEYHGVADETLEDIQDAVEMALEENDIGGDGSAEEQPEVVYASGVLTMALPPHGTWVLNKQTPNRQIWWSSPISGPKRYGYDPGTSEWIDTRGGGGSEPETLTAAIAEEVERIYGIELDL